MNTTTYAPHTADNYQPSEITRTDSSLSGKLYRFHGLPVVDVSGEPVGQVDWIWQDEATSQGEFIGVGLRWLRGTACAIPTRDVQIDHAAGIVRVAFGKEQIKKARRLSIAKTPTAREKRAVYSQYQAPRALVGRGAVSDALAA